MRLEHYTDQVFSFEHDRIYEQKPPMGFMKPLGFWVSVAGDDDWPAWCRAEEFCLSSLEHVSEVKLVENANILMVTNGLQLDAIHYTYGVDTDGFKPSGSDERRYWSMDWRKVAADCDGIIIAPYLWSHRLDGPMWYYGWDCASGVIWNLDAVASVEVVM